MQFHPSKCLVVRVTNKRKPIQASYNIHGMTFEEVSSAKYLGLHVDKKLSFNTHVDITCKKANSTRALLQHNFSHCSCKIKEATYKTYFRPIAEYASVAWDPNTQRNIRKIEQIQRRSARYVTNTYDRRSRVTSLLSELQWPSLQERRPQSSNRPTLQDPLQSGGHKLERPSLRINIYTAVLKFTTHPSSLAPAESGIHWRWIHLTSRRSMPSNQHWGEPPSSLQSSSFFNCTSPLYINLHLKFWIGTWWLRTHQLPVTVCESSWNIKPTLYMELGRRQRKRKNWK